MLILVTVVHVLVCFGLIVVVLLQTGKGADMGAAFGGGSSGTVFGSSGAGTFLTRLTTGMAVVFMLTSLTLGYFAGRRPSSSVFDRAELPERSAPGDAVPMPPGPRKQASPVTTPAAPGTPEAPPTGR